MLIILEEEKTLTPVIKIGTNEVKASNNLPLIKRAFLFKTKLSSQFT